MTWCFGLDLGVLYPSGSVLENLRSLAWQMGLEFEGYANRGWLGSTVQIRVNGEPHIVQQYATAVANHWH